MSLQDFARLVDAMMSSSADRTPESVFQKELMENPLAVLDLLFGLLAESSQGRAKFCVLLLTNVFRQNVLVNTVPDVDSSIQSRLFSLVASNKFDLSFYSILSNLIVRAFMFYLSHERGWNDFFATVESFCLSQDNVAACTSLDIIHFCVLNQLLTSYSHLDEIYQAALGSNCPERLYCAFRIMCVSPEGPERPACYTHFRDNFPGILAQCSQEMMNLFLSEACGFIPSHPESFTQELLDLLIRMFVDGNCATGTRVLALELLLEVIENHCEPFLGCVGALLDAMISVICELDETDDIYDEQYEDDTPRTSTEEGVERLVMVYQKSDVFGEQICQKASALLGDGHFAKRRAGLMLLLPCVEHRQVCVFGMQEDLVKYCCEHISPHESILCVNAVFQMLSAMSKSFGSEFHRDFGHVVIPILIEYISAVKSQHALSALASLLSNSSEELDGDDSAKILRVSMEVIAGNSNIQSKIFAMRCIGALIEGMEDVSGFYGEIRGFLLQAIEHGPMLFALESMIVFGAIGRGFLADEYVSDAVKILGALAGAKPQEMDHQTLKSFNEALKSFALALAGVVPDCFVALMGGVLASAGQDIASHVISGPVDKYATAGEVVVYDKSAHETRLFSRADLDDVAESFGTLSFLLDSLDQALIPMLQDIIRVLCKGVMSWYSPDIQINAFECVCFLIATLARIQFNNPEVLVSVIDSYLSVGDSIDDLSVVQSFVDMASTLASFVIKTQQSADAWLPKFVGVVKQAVKSGEESALACAYLLDKCFRMSHRSDIFDQELQTLFSDQGKVLVLASCVKYCEVDQNFANGAFEFILRALVEFEAEAIAAPAEALYWLLESGKMDAGQIHNAMRAILEVIVNREQFSVTACGFLSLCLATAFSKCAEAVTPEFVTHWTSMLPIGKSLGCQFAAVYDVFTALLCDRGILPSIVSLDVILNILAKASTSSAFSDDARKKSIDYLRRTSGTEEFQAAFESLSEKRRAQLESLVA